MLVTLLVRTGLDTITPNQILGDIMTDDAYRDIDEKEEKNKEKKDEKKKSVAFKAGSSSKDKDKQDHQVKMMAHGMMMMMRRWLSLSRDLANS